MSNENKFDCSGLKFEKVGPYLHIIDQATGKVDVLLSTQVLREPRGCDDTIKLRDVTEAHDTAQKVTNSLLSETTTESDRQSDQ